MNEQTEKLKDEFLNKIGLKGRFGEIWLNDLIDALLQSQRDSLVGKIEGLDKWGSAEFGGMITKENGGWIKLQDILSLIKEE